MTFLVRAAILTLLFMRNMNMYYVTETDGTTRFFDVSHDGLEDAIEFANSIGEDVCRNSQEGASECVWSFDESGDTEPAEPFDGFNSDAEADADALASAGFGTDEDYGGFDDYNDGY